MEANWKLLRAIRKNILSELEGLSVSQLNYVPPGFNNNLIWNAGHALVTQLLLCYKNSGSEMWIAPETVNLFRKGTRPDFFIELGDICEVRFLLNESPDILQRNYEAGDFQKYMPYETNSGLTISSIEEAIVFNNYHEGLHLGYMKALKRVGERSGSREWEL